MPWGHPANCKGNAPLRINIPQCASSKQFLSRGVAEASCVLTVLICRSLGLKYPAQLPKVLHFSLLKGLRDHDGLRKHACWQGTSTTDLSSADCLLLVLWEILGNLSLCYRGCEQPHARTRVTYIGDEDRFWTSKSPSG